jgi:hypothetical protein
MRKVYLFLFVVAMQILMGIAVHAQTQTIFDYASSWRYLDDGSNQGTTWKETGYNDATWSSGTGIFGYGDGWITVCVKGCAATACGSSGCSTKFITTYFRKTVNIPDVSKYSGITLNVWRDDGIVVYVNGAEVWRSNMPTGTILFNTNAASTIDGANENTPVSQTIPISAFVNGNNVIAVEVHQRDGNSSDLTFNMQALGVVKTNLMAFGSAWKYATGTDLGTTWRNTSFNDAAWATGTGHMGYGETWTNTCVPAGAGCPTYSAAGPCNSVGSCTKYPTIYFRKTLNIPDATLFDSVRFSVYMDDGVVMYVNGTEVWRHNMPTGTILYSTLTPTQIAESTAVVRAIPISAFTSGDNVIAFELHQNGTGASSTSSDADFNVQATGVARIPVTLTRGPYLQMGNETAFTVRWRTNVASNSKLEVGTTYGTYPIVVTDPAMVVDHEVRVTGLTPDTKYFYRFGTTTDSLQGDTTNFWVTAPATATNKRVTIAAYGDCGQNAASRQTGALTAYRNYLSSIGLQAADMMILIGDNAYNSGTDAEYQTGFFNAYQGNILKNHMLFPAPGNHDYSNGSSARQNDHNIPYYSIFTMPANGECGGVPSGNERFYSFDRGDVHFLSLDSYGRENSGTTRLYDTLGAQVQWIKADLAANTKKWVIAYWHHPPYTMGSHNSDNEGELVAIRQNFVRILERYGVDIIICGHSHDYERSYLIKGHYGNEASFNVATHAVDNSSAKYDGSSNSCPYTTTSAKEAHGTVYVVSGSSGANGGIQSGYPHNAMPFSINDGGMFFLDITNNRLDAKFLRMGGTGTVWDQFTIMKDVKTQDTVEILHGNSTTLSASWEGNYAWAPGVTTRTITVAPTQDTLVEVKDNATATCLTDKHFVNMLCTMPDITSAPTGFIREACDAAITYSISDTGRPAPVHTYTLAGATTGSGNGTASGTLFSVGVTTVTIAASNECGVATTTFTVTINAAPEAYTVTGGGGYCPGGSGVAIGLGGSQTDATYQLYNGSSAVGSAVNGTGGALFFGIHSVPGTYSVLATNTTTTCTNAMLNTVNVNIYTPPTAMNVTGGGSYCLGGSGATITLDGSQTNVTYQLYEGSTAVGSAVSGTGSAIALGTYTTIGTYTVAATDITTTCTNDMAGSTTITIDPLPVVQTVTGGGHYCTGGAGVPVGLAHTQANVTYYLYNGSTATGSMVTGTGTSISFGLQTAAGTYTVAAINNTTGCAGEMAGVATVTPDALPVSYNVTGGGQYCSGGSGVAIGLSGTEAGITYQLQLGSAASGAPVAGSGSASSFGLRTAAGSYHVTAENNVTGCTNTMNGTAEVVINGLPTVFAVTGGGTYCAGGAGVAVGLGGSSVGFSYQLFHGTTPSGSSVAGNGLPLSFGTRTAPGSYNVVATNTTTTCTNAMSGIATVSVNAVVAPSTNISVLPNDTVCAGTMATFYATPANGGATPGVEWKINGTTVATAGYTYSFTPNNGDVVSVILYSSLPCVTSPIVTNDLGMTVKANVTPAATIVANPGDSVCEGTTVTFTAANTNGGDIPVYQWLKNSVPVGGGTSYTYTPNNGDGVVATLSSNADCRLADLVYSNILHMKVDDSYLPSVNIGAVPGLYIASGQPVTFTATVTDGGITPAYQWKKNNTTIAGATNMTYTTNNLADNDTITCMVKGGGSCGREGFNSIVMHVTTGLNTMATGNTLSIVPNPTKGRFTITGKMATDGLATITICNVLGQEVYKQTTSITAGTLTQDVVLAQHLAAGTYIVTVGSANGRTTLPLVLNK